MSFGRKIEQRFGVSSLGPQERITYHGDLKPFLKVVSDSYDFGEYVSHEVKQNGYEDFNLVLKATSGTFFVKCFYEGRDEKDCRRYLGIIEEAVRGGVRTPKLCQNKLGDNLTQVTMDGATVFLCAMQYLDGGNIWESGKRPTSEEQAEAIRQAVKINSLDIDPGGDEDSWAIINITKKYNENKSRVALSEQPLIEKLIDELSREDEYVKAIPKTLVHGDIRSTNVMRSSGDPIYVIDFSVARRYPRIMEMAVLCCDILFDMESPGEFSEKYEWALSRYKKAGTMLTGDELRLLPLFVRLAHAANVVGGSSTDATSYISKKETEYWLKLGTIGLHYTVEEWKPNLH
ncbi:MAG: phosphotransferase [Patescibacteria group bacterium]|nr:phosphotransferase [Patescibacteria group bacterium]